MDKDGNTRVCAKRSGDRVVEVDRLRNLPDLLLFQILLKLPTKDVVKCSVLSRAWRNIWRYVPGLDLKSDDFMDYNCYDSSDHKALVSFVNSFLGFNSESCLHKFRLTVNNWYEDAWFDTAPFTHWINTVVKRKVQHLHIQDTPWGLEEVRIPPTVYTCQSLVSLTLCYVGLPCPKFVSLPSLKVIVLDETGNINGLTFEMLISGCPVLESLTVKNIFDRYELKVCSQSLLSFTHVADKRYFHCVVIDAPRLEYLRLIDKQTASFISENLGSLVEDHEMDMDTEFYFENKFDPNDLTKRHKIRNYLVGTSCVKSMIISSTILEVIYDYSRCEQLPLFRNISFLRVEFTDYRWEMLPIFLETCPNLKSLVLGFSIRPEEEGVSILPGPRRFLTSLEYVKIVLPMIEEATEIKLKLVSYILENSTILKKLTLCLGSLREKEESIILKKLLTIPRLSTSCQVFVL